MSIIGIFRALWRVTVALTALAGMLTLLVAVPWGLWHFIRWPLPDHLPSWAELEATLSSPLTDTLLLNLLALIAWPIWLTFAIDVARCLPDAVHGIRPLPRGPIHALAALLLAASVLGLLGPYADRHDRDARTDPLEGTPIAKVRLQPAPGGVALAAHESRPVATDGTVTVQPPHHGIHDSLWRIAQRELGDGTRWPELYEANKGRTQADGRTLCDPNLIHPGWILELPDRRDKAERADEPTLDKAEAGSDHARARTEAAKPTQQQPAPNRPAVTDSPNHGLDLVTGAFLSTALAAAVTMIMLAVRRRRERAYRPGSGDRRPPAPPAPVARALRIADDQRHLDVVAEPSPTGDHEPEIQGGEASAETRGDVSTAAHSPAVDIGVRDGRAQAVNLAALRGLGLTGPGAEGAARALLLHLLAVTEVFVIVPKRDVVALLGDDLPISQRLRVVANLDAAATELADHTSQDSGSRTRTVLLASVDQPDRTLQSVIDNGSDRGVAAVLLGPWPAGATVRVRGDGLVTAASPHVEAKLRGTRLFHANATDTRDIVEFLAAAPEPATTDESTPESANVDRGVPAPRISADGETTDDDAGPVDVGDKPTTGLNAAPHHPLPEADCETRDRPWLLTVFGHFELVWKPDDAQQVAAPLSPKHRELITFLAVHPSGASRDGVREALWPDATGKRPFNAFYATLSQVRKALDRCSGGHGDDVIIQHGERVALNRNVVTVDYWEMAAADQARRTATTDANRVTAWERIAASYTGRIDLDIHPLWLDGPREEAQRTAVDALSALAAHYRDTDPQRRLQLLDHARMLNPDNEAIYREIIETQAALGLTDAIPRTVGLLTHTLAETGQRPSTATLLLARELGARHG